MGDRNAKEVEAGLANGTSNGYVIPEGSQATLVKKDTGGSEDEEEERGNWTGRLDFLLSCIGFAVGLGNVWRFPYLCYRNGGGAFLIPYVIMLLFAGLPLFFMELSFGQYASLGPISIWRVSPLFKGLGYGMIIISGIVCVYYNVIIAYTIFYLFASFTDEVPWSKCGKAWNTCNCTDMRKTVGNDTMNATMTTTATTLMNATQSTINATMNPVCPYYKAKTPSEEYWTNYVLKLSSGLDEPGDFRWELAGVLLLAWVIIFFCLIKGVKSSGKVVYFTATFPYVVLIILLIRGVTLPGYWKGIEFYIYPNVTKLGEARVWGDAAVQIFYSLGPAWGGLITMASYNKFNNNCYKDAVIVAFTNCGTSVFAGFVIFSVIGFMADYTGQEVKDVVASGPGLAFIAYPEGIARMPVAPLWAILFFFMLFTLGLDSQFVMLETVVSALTDEFPTYLRKRKILFTGVVCVIMYLLAFPLITQGGMYMFNIVDWYSAGQSLMIIALVECLVLAYIYGFRRFRGDINQMLGYTPWTMWYFLACWLFLTPVIIIFIIVFTSVSYKPVTYGKYEYPWWGEMIGWMMSLVSILMFPLFACITYIQYYMKYPDRGFLEILKLTIEPAEDWGPAHEVQNRNQKKADMEPPAFDNLAMQQYVTRM